MLHHNFWLVRYEFWAVSQLDEPQTMWFTVPASDCHVNTKGPSIAENVKQQKHTILPVFLSLSVVRGGRILPLESRSELFLENLFFGKKMYPSNAERSFFSLKGEKYSVRPAEHTRVNPSHAGTNPRIHDYLVLVKPSDIKWNRVTRKWHQVTPSETEWGRSETEWHQVKPSDTKWNQVHSVTRTSKAKSGKRTNFEIFHIPKYPSVTPGHTESVVFQEVAGLDHDVVFLFVSWCMTQVGYICTTLADCWFCSFGSS